MSTTTLESLQLVTPVILQAPSLTELNLITPLNQKTSEKIEMFVVAKNYNFMKQYMYINAGGGLPYSS
jgi:hypothetical protein